MLVEDRTLTHGPASSLFVSVPFPPQSRRVTQWARPTPAHEGGCMIREELRAWALGILEQAVNKPGLWSRGRPCLHPQTANTTLRSDQGKSGWGFACWGTRPPSHSCPASSSRREGGSGSALGTFSFLGPCASLPSPLILHAAPFL